jgi:hypothetical protein
MRICPLSMLKDSVCVFPRPDQVPIGRQPTATGFAAGLASGWHAQHIKAAAIRTVFIAFTKVE